MTHFEPAVVDAVLRHMNDDHRDDNLMIVRAFAAPDATAATMTGLDGHAAWWRVTTTAGAERDVRVPWPAAPITERAEIRREVVALYEAACARLGESPASH